MRFLASGPTLLGTWYSFFLMRLYVSFRVWVSKLNSGTLRIIQKSLDMNLRRFAHKESVEDAAQRPDVHLVAVALLAEHLGRDVVGGPAQRLLPLAVIVHLGICLNYFFKLNV